MAGLPTALYIYIYIKMPSLNKNKIYAKKKKQIKIWYTGKKCSHDR